MARSPDKTNLPKLDAFVENIVSDPNNPPDMVHLSGFVGKSSLPEQTRLYFAPDLKDYVDIPNEAILASQAIPKEESRFGGWDLWIRADAVLTHNQGPNRAKARFLEGRIQQGYGGAAAAMGPGAALAHEQQLVSPHFWKCTWYCVRTSTGVGGCATAGCTSDICQGPPFLTPICATPRPYPPYC